MNLGNIDFANRPLSVQRVVGNVRSDWLFAIFDVLLGCGTIVIGHLWYDCYWLILAIFDIDDSWHEAILFISGTIFIGYVSHDLILAIHVLIPNSFITGSLCFLGQYHAFRVDDL